MAALAACLGAALAACGGSEGPAPGKATPAPPTATASPTPTATPAVTMPERPDAPPAVPDEAQRTIAKSVCDVLHALPARRRAECCGGAPPGDLTIACTDALAVAIAGGAVRVEAADVERCAQEAAKALEGCGWVTPLAAPLPEVCRSLLHGTLQAKARCQSSVECADGLTCLGVSPTAAGVCAPPSPAAGPCTTTADPLAALTLTREDPRHPLCEGRCIKGVCLAFTAAGAPCESSGACAPGLNCIAGTCQDAPLSAAGQPCTVTDCAAGTYCHEGRCEPLKDEGEPCKLPFECRGLTCARPEGSETGTCGPPCGSLAPAPG